MFRQKRNQLKSSLATIGSFAYKIHKCNTPMQTETTKPIEITEDFINLKRLVQNKNPKLLRYIPGFLFTWLKNILHLDEVNGAIYRNRDRIGLDFVDAILEEFGSNIEVRNAHLIPKTGRITVASNHPLGGLDGMALMQAVGRERRDIVFPVNDILMYLPNLKVLFIPINKMGKNNKNAHALNDIFATDHALLYFPAGMCSRKIDGKITDLEWKKTFITKSKQHERTIVPTYIEGYNTNFFYNLSNLRKKLGIKANIEMLYLVDEMYRQKTKKIIITFGEPISYTTLDSSKTDREWALHIRETVYAMKSKK